MNSKKSYLRELGCKSTFDTMTSAFRFKTFDLNGSNVQNTIKRKKLGSNGLNVQNSYEFRGSNLNGMRVK